VNFGRRNRKNWPVARSFATGGLWGVVWLAAGGVGEGAFQIAAHFGTTAFFPFLPAGFRPGKLKHVRRVVRTEEDDFLPQLGVCVAQRFQSNVAHCFFQSLGAIVRRYGPLGRFVQRRRSGGFMETAPGAMFGYFTSHVSSAKPSSGWQGGIKKLFPRIFGADLACAAVLASMRFKTSSLPVLLVGWLCGNRLLRLLFFEHGGKSSPQNRRCGFRRALSVAAPGLVGPFHRQTFWPRALLRVG